MAEPEIPAAIREAAAARALARAARDWPTADRLRGEIEAAGWKVIDGGLDWRLEPAHPADLLEHGFTRYGRSERVPSRLGEPDQGPATLLVVAREDPAGSVRAVRSGLAMAPPGVDAVVVLDGLSPAAAAEARASAMDAARAAAFGAEIEVVETGAALGQGAAWNIGLRRSTGRVVVLLDASVEASGDLVGPVVAALDDPRVAVAGPLGLASADLRHFEETATGPAAAVEAYVMGFRRADAAERGPVDEGFRFYRNLDIWWSLVLRDAGRGQPPREARVLPGVAIRRHEHVAWSSVEPAERERLSRRNFYRVLDRFRDRLDLAVPPG